LDPLADSATVPEDVTMRYPMPWGKSGEIKLRMWREADGSVTIRIYRKGADTTDPWGA
jgi:hypothetical protein